MFAEPTINDFHDLVRWHIRKATERASAEVTKIRREASAAGALGGRSVLFASQAAFEEFTRGVEAVLGELKRTIRITPLDRNDLRQAAIGELENFALAIKSIAKTPESSQMGRYMTEKQAAIDDHLRFAVRQFDVGFLVPAEPEVPPVSNSITIGNMTGSTIQQGSPGATQSAQVAINVAEVRSTLDSFEAALPHLPDKALMEASGDIATMRAQLEKPSPVPSILRETGKSLRKIVESAGDAMIKPGVAAAATALWKSLGIS